MYTKLAVKTADSLLSKHVIKEEDRPIYEYSLEVLYSDLVYGAVAVMTALIFKAGLETLVFLLGFLPLRKVAGGYHASTYRRCHFLFWLNQLAMIGCYYLVPEQAYRLTAWLLIALSCVCVFLLAPVESENKPLEEKEKKRFYLLSRALLVAVVIAAAVLDSLHIGFKYILIYSFGVVSVALSLLAETTKNHFKKRRCDHVKE